MDINSIMDLDPADNHYWEHPENYALVKENQNGLNFYSIFGVDRPQLMITLMDDFEYGVKLTNKMIESGVRIFEEFEDLLKWHKDKFADSNT